MNQSTSDLHERFEFGIKRELAEAERNQKSAETPKRLHQVLRLIEMLGVVYLIYQLFFGDGISSDFVTLILVWLLVSPAQFFYRVWLELLSNANRNFSNAEILKTKNEVLYELDELKRKSGL